MPKPQGVQAEVLKPWGFVNIFRRPFIYTFRKLYGCYKRNFSITLPTKVRIVKAMAFLVVMYGHESWTITEAECQTLDAFELWC